MPGKDKVETLSPPLKAIAALAVISFTLTGCGARRTVRRPRVPPPPAPATAPSTARVIQGEKGIASWYGEPFHGRRTANGEVYNMYAISQRIRPYLSERKSWSTT